MLNKGEYCMDIRENTVSAVNQMKNSSRVYHLGSPSAKTRILVVGNSITRHGPNKDIGWERDWGMAASSPEKDYVHRLFAMLKEDGQDIFMRVSQCSGWERKFHQDDILSDYEEDRTFNADILVFRLGENILQEDAPYLKEPMEKFIKHICPMGKAVYTTCLWGNPIVDEIIKNIAMQRKEICIDACFSSDKKNMALGQFAHGGVAMHPSDDGMEEIAKAIFNALKGLLK